MPHDEAGRGSRRRHRAARGRGAATSASCAISPATRLAAFKVPRRIVFLDEIPKGATGKLQRIGLAEKLGLTAMKIAIFGAGAIGGLLAARLQQAGAEVTVIARGPHLAAMQANGLTLQQRRRDASPSARAAWRTPPKPGVQDCGDRHAEGARAARRRARRSPRMMGPETALVTGDQRRALLVFLRPRRPLARPARWRASIPAAGCGTSCRPRQAIGCVVYPAAEVIEPGVIEHTYGDRFTPGRAGRQPQRRASRRCRSC